jgi:hypothetical protein
VKQHSSSLPFSCLSMAHVVPAQHHARDAPLYEEKGSGTETGEPMWRQSSFFGAFLDQFIRNTDLEGGQTAPSLETLCFIFTECLQDLALKDRWPLFSDSEIEKLHDVVTVMRTALEFVQRNPGDEAEFISKVNYAVARVESLEVGSEFCVLGGWVTKTQSAHAIVFIVERVSQDEFAWVVCNTGRGVEDYHPKSDHCYPETKFKTALRYQGISRERITSPHFWYMTLRLTMQPSDCNTPVALYESILPHLRRSDNHFVTNAEVSTSGDWERPQKSGTCFYRCLLSALAYLLKTRGFSTFQKKQLFVLIRIGYLKHVKRDLGNHIWKSGLNDSDAYLIKLACNQTCLATARLCTTTIDSDNARFAFAQYVETLTRNIMCTVDGIISDPPQDSGKALCVKVPMQPFQGFELLCDESDRNSRRGYPCGGSVPVYMDYTCPLSLPKTVEEHCLVIEWCQLQCDAIRSRTNLTAVSTVLYQLRGFVEHVFLNELICPDVFSYADEVNGSQLWWLRSSLGIDTQKRCLSSLSSISNHYVAACQSLPMDRADRTTMSITLGVLYVFFDAIIRVEASPTSSPVSILLETGNFGSSMLSSSLLNNNSIHDLLADGLVVAPNVAIARKNLFSYFEHLSKRESEMKSLHIFSYEVIRDRHFYIAVETKSGALQFSKQLRNVLDPAGATLPSMPENGRKVEIHSNVSDIELSFAWFMSTWANMCVEFAQYRDLNFLFQLMLQPTDLFDVPNANFSNSNRIWSPDDSKIVTYFSGATRDKKKLYFLLQICQREFVYPKLKEICPLINRLLSLPPSTIVNEQYLLNASNLQTLDNALTPQESEQIMSYLAHPHLTVPLLLNFLCGDRLGLLLNSQMRDLVETVLFEPGKYSSVSSVTIAQQVTSIPVTSGQPGLSTALGIMMEETLFNADQILPPLKKLCLESYSLCTGGYKNSVVSMLLFVIRQTSRVISMCVANNVGGNLVDEINLLLSREVVPRLNRWANEALDDKNTVAALCLFSHSILIYENALDIHFTNESSIDSEGKPVLSLIKEYLCGCAFVVSWNTKLTDQSTEKLDMIPSLFSLIPVFSGLQKFKSRILRFARANNIFMESCLDGIESVFMI